MLDAGDEHRHWGRGLSLSSLFSALIGEHPVDLGKKERKTWGALKTSMFPTIDRFRELDAAGLGKTYLSVWLLNIIRDRLARGRRIHETEYFSRLIFRQELNSFWTRWTATDELRNWVVIRFLMFVSLVISL